MKLVEILARELKDWPRTAAFSYSSGTLARFATIKGKTIADYMTISEEPEDHMIARVTRTEWQAAVDALKADECAHSHGSEEGCPECGATKPYSSLGDQEISRITRVAAWNGTGLPPVGAVCEHQVFGCAGWSKAAVLAYGEKKTFYRDEDGHELSRLSDELKFRPIRTPEQIAAEERSLAVSEIINLIGWPHTVEADIAASRLYDAGYRKQEPK